MRAAATGPREGGALIRRGKDAHLRLSELSARYEGAGARLAASHAAPIKLLQFCGKLRGRAAGGVA